MNTTKRDRIKQEIEFADIDFQDIDKSISRMELKRNAEYVKTGKPVSLSDVIDKSNLTDYEKQNRENSISQCLYVDLMQRHIFYDLDTDILFLFENGDGELIHTTSGKNVIEEYKRKVGTERITRLGMNSPTSVFLKEVHYTDSNEKKGLFYDEMTDSYAIMK